MSFGGFPPEAIRFYEGLGSDNSKAYWTAHKDLYERAVRVPMQALCDEVAERFRPLKIFRPYRDVRFAKDKAPYKDHCGAYGESEGGAGYYVQLSSRGLLAGAGYYDMAKDQLVRFREALGSEAGAEVAALVRAMERKGFTAGAIGELKTAPKGYARDHPRVELLRRKGLILMRGWPVEPWLHTAKAKGKVESAWAAADGVVAWLDTHVGPSELPPEDAW